MDCSKIGKLIVTLRKEKGMTQKQLADVLHISDKTISKWERGLGCPDVSLLGELSGVLGVNIEKILSGSLKPNDADGGNMKKIKFYVCATCGNTLTATGEAVVSCCGRKLAPLTAKPADETHRLLTAEVEDEYYVTSAHAMCKEHFLRFIAYVTYDKVLFIKLYPEQNAEARFPKMQRGKLYFCCSRHGLWVNE